VTNYFKVLSAIDVSAQVKQKGQFAYLSWPFAIETLGQHHPDAQIQVQRFPLPSNPDFLVPYMETPLGYFVEVSVIINGVKRSQIHPILNYKNESVGVPTTFEVNTSIQRAMVKAIAMHGLGLFVYQGEDLPLNMPEYTEQQYELFNQYIDDDDALGLHVLLKTIPVNAMFALNGSFPKGQKVKMKEHIKELDKRGFEMVMKYEEMFKSSIDSGDKAGLIESANEVGEAGKALIWQGLSAEHQIAARELLKD